MKKTVIVYEVYETPIEVDADSDEEALNTVEIFIKNGYDDYGNTIPDGIYSYCLDKSEWKVLNC